MCVRETSDKVHKLNEILKESTLRISRPSNPRPPWRTFPIGVEYVKENGYPHYKRGMMGHSVGIEVEEYPFIEPGRSGPSSRDWSSPSSPPSTGRIFPDSTWSRTPRHGNGVRGPERIPALRVDRLPLSGRLRENMKPTIVFQGGAINPSDGEFGDTAIGHLQVGVDILKDGGAALGRGHRRHHLGRGRPLYHAGTGARLNLKGQIELDATIMDGRPSRPGSVGGIQRVKNPIQVAKAVMDETDHVLLVGEEAEIIARKMGFEEFDPELPHRREEWKDLRAKILSGEELGGFYSYWKKIRKWADTVGCGAVDRDGNFAAGTASGGFPLKMPGRVGDVGVIGAAARSPERRGRHHDHRGRRARHQDLSRVPGRPEHEGGQIRAGRAAEEAVKDLNARFDNPLMFLICIDKDGNMGSASERSPDAAFPLARGMDAPEGNFGSVFE